MTPPLFPAFHLFCDQVRPSAGVGGGTVGRNMEVQEVNHKGPQNYNSPGIAWTEPLLIKKRGLHQYVHTADTVFELRDRLTVASRVYTLRASSGNPEGGPFFRLVRPSEGGLHPLPFISVPVPHLPHPSPVAIVSPKHLFFKKGGRSNVKFCLPFFRWLPGNKCGNPRPPRYTGI